LASGPSNRVETSNVSLHRINPRNAPSIDFRQPLGHHCRSGRGTYPIRRGSVIFPGGRWGKSRPCDLGDTKAHNAICQRFYNVPGGEAFTVGPRIGGPDWLGNFAGFTRIALFKDGRSERIFSRLQISAANQQSPSVPSCASSINLTIEPPAAFLSVQLPNRGTPNSWRLRRFHN
jgi:hypothetical protein